MASGVPNGRARAMAHRYWCLASLCLCLLLLPSALADSSDRAVPGLKGALNDTNFLAFLEEQAKVYFNGTVSEDELPYVAQAAYAMWWALPLVIIAPNFPSNGFTKVSQINEFIMQQAPDNSSNNNIVTPNVNVLYGPGFFDLSAGPMIVSVPDTGSRYYVLQMMSFWGAISFQNLGFVETGTQAGKFFVYGPDYKGTIPKAFVGKSYQCPTQGLWIMMRMQVMPGNNTDIAIANSLTAQMSLTPWGPKQKSKPKAVISRALAANKLWESFVKGRSLDFWKAYNLMVPLNQPLPVFLPFMVNFNSTYPITTAGINLDTLKPGLAKTLAKGTDLGYALMANLTGVEDSLYSCCNVTIVSDNIVTPAGWRTSASTGAANNVAEAAVTAYWYIAANPASEAIYWSNYKDVCGNNLVLGSTYSMNVTSRPPYNAFWSITTYNSSNAFLLPTTEDKYSVGSDTLGVQLTPSDGAYIYISATPPPASTKVPFGNWLPLGDGKLNPSIAVYYIFRIYAPQNPNQTVYNYQPAGLIPTDPTTLALLPCASTGR